jgi:hypothetical protein
MSAATFMRIHPAWRCVCGRTLRAWDVSVEDGTGTAQTPFRILCNGCHTELVAVERHSETQSTEGKES